MIADYEVTSCLQWENDEDGLLNSCAAQALGARLKVDVLTEQLHGVEESILKGDNHDDDGNDVRLEVRVEVYETLGKEPEASEPTQGRPLAQSPVNSAPILILTQAVDRAAAVTATQLPGRRLAETVADVAQSEVTSFAPITATSSRYGSSVVSLEGVIQCPHLWSAEVPYLYTVVVSLQYVKGGRQGYDSVIEQVDVEACRVGLREVSVGGPHHQLCVNRRPITIAGVNRHEFDCYNGRAVSEQTMQLDASIMKQMNFNAVRLSHYPTHPRWLEICDAAGLYVIDEANIESHGFQVAGQPVGYLSSLPEWLGAHLSRAARMFERDKNFSSIIGWSLGNESGIGKAHQTMYAWLKARDSSGRFVQYEPGGARSTITDIICPMYLRPEWCMQQALSDSKLRPVILCEYAHAMGNSAGKDNAYTHTLNTIRRPPYWVSFNY